MKTRKINERYFDAVVGDGLLNDGWKETARKAGKVIIVKGAEAPKPKATPSIAAPAKPKANPVAKKKAPAKKNASARSALTL